MLDDPDLAHHNPDRRRVTQIGSAAATRRQQVVDHLVRVGDDLQREAGRAGLLARPTRRASPLAEGSKAASSCACWVTTTSNCSRVS